MSLARMSRKPHRPVGTPIYDKPKIAALEYRVSGFGSTMLAADYARYHILILGLTVSNIGSSFGSRGAGRQFAVDCKALNPAIKIGQYTILTDMPTNADYTSHVAALDANSWWLRDAAAPSEKLQYDTSFAGVYQTNPTTYVTADAEGKRWPQKCADCFYTSKLKNMYDDGVLDFAFNDNVFARYRAAKVNPGNVFKYTSTTTGDLNLNGTNDLITDATLQAAIRQGYADYWAALQALMPGLEVMPNTEAYSINSNFPSIDYSEMTGRAKYPFLEGITSKVYSPETYAGVGGWHNYYSHAISASKDGSGVICHYSGDSVRQADAFWAIARSGIAATLMKDGGYACFTDQPNGGTHAAAWQDENDARIGAPIDGPQSSANSNGIWLRRFVNGAAVWNPLSNKGKHFGDNSTGGGFATLTRVSSGTKVRMTGWTHGRSNGDVIRIMGKYDAPSFNIVGAVVTVIDSTTLEWDQVGTNGETKLGGAGSFGARSTIDLTGLGYKRIAGVLDVTNDGSTVTTLQLYPEDGAVLVK